VLATLRVLLGSLGIAAVLICLSIFMLGAQTTAWSGERLVGAIAHWRAPPSEPWPTSMDSELRFYAPFWGVYGLALLRVALAPAGRLGWTPWLAALFFAGGVGRAISYAAVGPPHPFFVVLMATELMLPPVLVILWLGARGRSP
jgi:hypothetical protein